ncbi:MAG: DegT/DnrJ/EryC1/StrS family aminotransferase [Planctomycetia bacterium]|nr:DegT/DnrJ/EryC1/StrS family aminotransferase [Planctomycetia bacterium]
MTDYESWTPAIMGGERAFPEGPPAWPPPDEDVLAALQKAYRDGSWGRYEGPNLEALITALQELLKVPHILPCSSGTIAVEIALRGLGVEPRDEVILGAYDFPGNFRAIEAIGATPVLIDLDPQTRCIDVDQAAAACGPLTKAMIATHLHGAVVDMRRLRELADDRKFRIVEDACQCSGAVVQGMPAGTWGDAGVFSFGGSKLLTAGRGGAVFTARADVYQRMKIFNERGNAAFPLSELQAAVLMPQLEKLPARGIARRSAARRLAAALAEAPGLIPVPTEPSDCRPEFYKLGLMFDLRPQESGEDISLSRDAFGNAARAEGIALDPGFRGFLRRTRRRCRQIGDCPIARCAAERTLVLHHPILMESEDAIDRVATTLRHLLTAFRDGAGTCSDPKTSSTPRDKARP